MTMCTFIGGVRTRRTWAALTSTPLIGLIGIGVAIGWMLIAAVGPLIAPYDPLAQSTATLASPGYAHFFGTDELGRDVFSRVLWGARVSVTYPIFIVGVSVAIGGALGVVSGYFGGWVDGLFMRATDLVFAFPTIILAMAIAAALGPDLKNSVIAIVAVTWPNYTRVVRSLVLSSMHSDFVRRQGLSGRRRSRDGRRRSPERCGTSARVCHCRARKRDAGTCRPFLSWPWLPTSHSGMGLNDH